MRNWRSLIEKDYLGSWDLVGPDGKPRDYTLEITAVDSQNLKTRETPKGKRKAVITLRGAKKKMVANTTNCETIEGMYGPDVDAWVGKLITLYQTDVRSPKGGTIRGVRVRPQVPKGKGEMIADHAVDEKVRSEQNEAFGREPGSDDV